MIGFDILAVVIVVALLLAMLGGYIYLIFDDPAFAGVIALTVVGCGIGIWACVRVIEMVFPT